MKYLINIVEYYLFFADVNRSLLVKKVLFLWFVTVPMVSFHPHVVLRYAAFFHLILKHSTSKVSWRGEQNVLKMFPTLTVAYYMFALAFEHSFTDASRK